MTRERRGVALVTALVLILILGAIATSVTSSAYSVSDTADNLRNRSIARYAAESGVVLARSRIEEKLSLLKDSTAIKSYMNGLEMSSSSAMVESLGAGRFQVAIVDVNSRLDVNSASAEQLTVLFSSLTTPGEARSAATAIRNRIDYGHISDSVQDILHAGIAKPPYATPLRSLEELNGITGVSPTVARAAAPFLTVDGDGRINAASASPAVMASAGGDLRDFPSRVLLISRGWNDVHPLTFEIQAVFAVEYGKLVMVSWRERDL